jgi:hypothetical protein
MSPQSISAPSVRPVGPRDCALAVAVPLTREQFLQDLAQPGRKDFASHIKRTNLQPGASGEYYWNTVYEPVARLAVQVCAEVEKLGVTVNRAARLSDLPDLLRQFKVVTLISHWRFRKVAPSDILDASGLLRALAEPKTLMQKAVRRAFEQYCPRLLIDDNVRRMPVDTLRQSVAEAVNNITAAAHKLYKPGQVEAPAETHGGGGLPNSPLERLTRVAFEMSFPEVILPGRAVEFDDGMYSVPEVIDSVPIGFCGLFDLTVCNSVILGEAIKNSRPTCIVAASRYPAELYLRLGFYSLIIRMLSRQPIPFIDAMTRLGGY